MFIAITHHESSQPQRGGMCDAPMNIPLGRLRWFDAVLLAAIKRMTPVKPLPRGSRWPLVIGLTVFFAGLVTAGLLSSPWPLVASVAGIVVCVEARGIRCPQCRRRLTLRKVPVGDGPAYKMFWECTHCVEIWDGQMTIDPNRD
jgi:hypothetical protein